MRKGGVDLVDMDDVSKLTNYARSDWLKGDGSLSVIESEKNCRVRFHVAK